VSVGAVLLTALGMVLVGAATGWVAWTLLSHDAYTQGVLDGQRQAELTHGGWHPVVSEGWNQPELPGRHRSPDRKAPRPVEPQPPTPVLHLP
jgi:hypothetical protein